MAYVGNSLDYYVLCKKILVKVRYFMKLSTFNDWRSNLEHFSTAHFRECDSRAHTFMPPSYIIIVQHINAMANEAKPHLLLNVALEYVLIIESPVCDLPLSLYITQARLPGSVASSFLREKPPQKIPPQKIPQTSSCWEGVLLTSLWSKVWWKIDLMGTRLKKIKQKENVKKALFYS